MFSKYLFLLLLAFGQSIFAQEFSLSKAFVRDSEDITIQLLIKNLKLDSINRIELKKNAILKLNDGTSLHSDEFLTDNYYDKAGNTYDIVFETAPETLKKIKSISGTVKYFTPSVANKAIQRIKIDETMKDKLVFKNLDIKVLYMDALKIDSLQNNQKNFSVWKAKIVSENKLNSKLFNTAITKYLKDRYRFEMPRNLTNNMLFYIENPTYHVAKNYVVKSDLYDFPEAGSEYHSKAWTFWELNYSLRSFPKNYEIELIMENKTAVKYYNFKIDLRKPE
ncbi:hypothetical protein [Soonwooa sp.]|uniref:hypothetical protein n=1 Tax=Soonwooa sp. TaxID=1938592 RepID=UPI00260EC417|nr:hypothetical protein [Soonwooa sp.]